jgi:hypothetical protein
MNIAPVCQPLAMRPPNRLAFAASSSRWKGCGSNWRAYSTISSFVTS